MKAIRMPSIEKFASAIHNISHSARYVGIVDDEVKYDYSLFLPVLDVKGTVKLHGTNASVCWNVNDGLWAQSKSKKLTPLKDNAGFAHFVEGNKLAFNVLTAMVFNKYSLDSQDTVTIYGEWAGKGVHGGVGISKIPKKFYIFGIKVTPPGDDEAAYWVPSNIFNLENYDNIFHIEDFGTFDLTIDFNNPAPSNNKMVDMMKAVEKECPVAKHFGISGIGEGIVFTTLFKEKTYRWKIKGDKHAGKSKVKKGRKIDLEKVSKVQKVANEVTPLWRLKQMYDECFDTLNGGIGDIRKTGDYIRSVLADVVKEDLDILEAEDLIMKDINREVSTISRNYLMERLNEEAGI